MKNFYEIMKQPLALGVYSPNHQLSEGGHIALFKRLDLYHKPPDSDERQDKSRTSNKRFDLALRAGLGLPS